MTEQRNLDIAAIDVVFNRMVETITSSKDDIFIISEKSRQSFEEMQNELAYVREQIKEAIDKSDSLERNTQLAKQRLAFVSKSFNEFTEVQIREAYENAHNLQISLAISMSEERQLRQKRDDLERRLRGLSDTIERADHIVNQVNVVLNYLLSDLKNVGAALEQAKIKQDFSMRIIAAQEDERKRLSREIHDGPAQMMAHVLMRSDLIERVYREKGIDQALDELHELKHNVRNALSEVRRIIYDLRPMALDDLGVVPTLKKYLSTAEEYNKGVEIHFQSVGSDRRLSSDIEVSVFRLVQEGVTNAIKHASSTDIWVKLEWRKDDLNIMVKDNGKGFNKDKISKAQSFGIIGMQERLELLEGSMKIISEPNQGALFLFKIPYEAKHIESNE
ncbi:signal transduction histidine-protein kinase/phosphatase DegS [Lysinibacillus alkalisoli]|uniref:Signal transduction histidine-protein kinase/phosphatase DegS n=1 Tax=Lysinibacillus alkalisoli TaxID=1911548 RepID=A0A917D8L4_9BACI|nr:sensor histidine kinase [Lysinibacillus alkalisoli]GGG13125.1 signal transduction histidine-protein kinase/phosphatase DegS [Lysinibacillus alkalisoli]